MINSCIAIVKTLTLIPETLLGYSVLTDVGEGLISGCPLYAKGFPPHVVVYSLNVDGMWPGSGRGTTCSHPPPSWSARLHGSGIEI